MHGAPTLADNGFHHRNGRYELDPMPAFMETIRSWVINRRQLVFVDARGCTVRVTEPSLEFPTSGANDVVLVLRDFARYHLVQTRHKQMKDIGGCQIRQAGNERWHCDVPHTHAPCPSSVMSASAINRLCKNRSVLLYTAAALAH